VPMIQYFRAFQTKFSGLKDKKYRRPYSPDRNVSRSTFSNDLEAVLENGFKRDKQKRNARPIRMNGETTSWTSYHKTGGTN